MRVSDTGTGMPKEVVERAFEPFFSTKPKGQGTGLGLATVYGVLAQAGGYVQIHSEPGIGTTVTCLLPATDAAPTGGQAEPVEQLAARDGSGRTVLLVEDEDALREVTRRILSRHGYQVISAGNGPEALALAERHHGPIHLLLTDVVMPHMLGRELADRMAHLNPDIRVLFVSGYAQPVLASQGTLEPDVVLLEKPFTEVALLRQVGLVLAAT
jgi:CheY-like chemotaxis protein